MHKNTRLTVHASIQSINQSVLFNVAYKQLFNDHRGENQLKGKTGV